MTVVKKTYPKILLLIISTSIVFIILYFTLYYYTKKIEREVFKNTTEQFENEVSKLLFLDSKHITVAINNDSNWDEFVDFTKTKDSIWFTETIGNEVNIYNVDYLGAYDVNGKHIMSVANSKIKSKNFIPPAAIKVIEKKGIHKFYMKIPEGIIEVAGASIHPSDDPLKNKAKSSGYFFVTRLMDDSFIQKLEALTNSKIEINQTKKDNNNNVNHQIHASINLSDYNNNQVLNLSFSRRFDIYFEKILNILFLIIATFVISLFFNFYYIGKLVYHPLDLITRVLLSGDRDAVRKLKRTSGEFRYIGNLFEENNKQKKELIKSKIKAEEGDRLKSSFLANLSHEIRTPMNAINGFTELMLNTKLTDEEKKEYLKIIDLSGKNLVSIIDDLIEMSKIDSNLIVPNYTSLNLESCINELYETIKITIPKSKDINFHIIPAKKPVEYNIVTDVIKLKQIIINLVTNAIKFTDKGTVSFGYSINEKKNQILFTITDTGLGINDYDQQHIFDRFKRIDSDVSIKVGGLGLGLSISKAYVEMLNGTIALKSNLGKGSEFSFTIPLEYNKIESITVHQVMDEKITSNKEKGLILIAEDDNINYILFEKIIKQKNFQIIRATNGKEAVEICLDNPNIDLVLMDIKMPIMNGFEALELIRPIRPNLPIVAQTAYSSSEDKEKIIAAGFNNFITKPLNREQLFEIINLYLNDKSSKS